MRALGRDGQPFEFEAEGLTAVCVQHEMDHLMGKVFVEYLSPLKRDRIRTKMLKKTRDEQRGLTPAADAGRRGRRMRVAFAGTPEFARVALAAVLDAGHERAAGADPARPPGRPRPEAAGLAGQAVGAGARPAAGAAAQPAAGRQVSRRRAGRARAALEAAAPDVMVVAAYGLILPPWVLALPRHGCLNIHGSLLPRWRGAAPIQRAIEAGDAATGITIMQMDAGLDTGAMLLVASTPIARRRHHAPRCTTAWRRWARGWSCRALERLAQGTLQPQAQPAEGVTYAHKIDKAEAAIDWRAPAAAIERRVRAFDPFPGASLGLGRPAGQGLARPRRAGRGRARGRCWRRADGRLVVACGEGALELLELQLPGGRRIAARDFLLRHPVTPG